jgi:hypothetical protein
MSTFLKKDFVYDDQCCSYERCDPTQNISSSEAWSYTVRPDVHEINN